MDVFLVCELRMAGSGSETRQNCFYTEQNSEGPFATWWLRWQESDRMQETRVQALGREDPLKKGMATHFSILAWEIPWTEKPGGLQSMGLQRIGLD